MKLVFLDAKTLGDDMDLSHFSRFGEVIVYDGSRPEEIAERINDADVVILNKAKLNENNLKDAKNLKLICETATGVDNIDLNYCEKKHITVKNVAGYSTDCVCQLTVTMALSLLTRMKEFTEYVDNGSYSRSGIANRLSPQYHEIAGMTWGILGYGNIGKAVGRVAEALGCRVIVCKRTPIPNAECVDFDTLCRESDILSIHTPLTNETRGMLDKTHIALLKRNAVVINVARGAVTDEEALADALLQGKIGGLGIDVYGKEPFTENDAMYRLLHHPHAILTPHMAWGGYETRFRLLQMVAQNIADFVGTESKDESRV